VWCMTKQRSTTGGRRVHHRLADINCATVSPAIHKITHAQHGHGSVVSHLSQIILQKYSKMQHIFAYNGLS